MDRRSVSMGALVAAVMLLAPGLYVGGYLALREMPEWIFNDISDQIIFYEPYSHGGSVAEHVFAPIHNIDRWLWPDYWEPETWLSGETSRYWPPGRRDSLFVGLDPDGQAASNRDLRFCSPPWSDPWVREEHERTLRESNAESGSDSAVCADVVR